ncbi:peptide deformylase [Streptomyces sp. NPDC101455]|uniref:peptide deformylase n=1 Tax=Streptomyces sp. NPDC101455 TaxID=3366142 RepID=UPI00381FE3D8
MRPSEQMRDLGIVQYGARILAEPARTFRLPAEQAKADSVMERLTAAHDFSGKGLGLAAPQVGINRAAAVVRPPGVDPIVLLNPRITGSSQATDERYEGCLSLFDVRALPPRTLQIAFETTALDGTTVTTAYKHGTARLIAHEIDHLLSGVAATAPPRPDAARRSAHPRRAVPHQRRGHRPALDVRVRERHTFMGRHRSPGPTAQASRGSPRPDADPPVSANDGVARRWTSGAVTGPPAAAPSKPLPARTRRGPRGRWT